MATRQLVCAVALGVVLTWVVATAAAAQSAAPSATPSATQSATQSVVRLPFVADDSACQLPAQESASSASFRVLAPVEETAAPATSPPTILPLGSQLDDVGQYYSQASPSLSSTLQIANMTGATQVFTVTLYGDTGNVVRTLADCRIAGGATGRLRIAGGQLTYQEGDYTLAPEAVCSHVVEGNDAQGFPAERLHGLYHAQITAGAPSSLQVSVHTEADPAYPQTVFKGAGSYEAVSKEQTAGMVALAGLLATRDLTNWWDTEVIIQNVGDAAVDLKLKLCTLGGDCFDNNAARLAPYERRLFLASHLLYEDTPDGVVERAGWYSASIYATRADAAGEAASVAVVANYFRQEVEAGAIYPKGERGSQDLYSTTPPPLAQEFEIPVGDPRSWHLRVYNPSLDTSLVQVTLIGSTGAPLGGWSREVGPHSTWAMPVDDLAFLPSQAESSAKVAQEPGLAASLTLRIVADRAVSVFAWDDTGGPLRPQLYSTGSDTPGGDTWYAPLLAAPIVPFRWDDNGGPARTLHPSAQFGLAETVPEEHRLRPAWARALNWYSFGHDERLCSETVGPYDPYSTYIPMWHGLGNCRGASPDDRSCLNSDARLQRVRNTLPSSCVGRPLFLANEPDLSGQTFMTFHELGRLIYVLRDWPGELFSPVFASYSYEHPVYPPERTEECRQAVALSLCPQTPGCEVCRQDGVVDGTRDPFDVSFKGLEAYFAEPHRWAHDQVWRFEDFIEGMLIHFYVTTTDVLDEQHWRAPFLRQYRDRAAEAGWPIIVKEYGFVNWPDEFGCAPTTGQTDIANLLDNSRRFLLANLGNREPVYGGNPFKLFWFETGCHDPNSFWGKLCLFHGPQQLSQPVGICWHHDAARNDMTDRLCGQTGPFD